MYLLAYSTRLTAGFCRTLHRFPVYLVFLLSSHFSGMNLTLSEYLFSFDYLQRKKCILLFTKRKSAAPHPMSTTDFRNHLLFLEFKNPVFLPRRFTALDLVRHRLINLPALKHWHLFMMLPQIQKRSSGTRHDHSGKKLGYRKSYSRK